MENAIVILFKICMNSYYTVANNSYTFKVGYFFIWLNAIAITISVQSSSFENFHMGNGHYKLNYLKN